MYENHRFVKIETRAGDYLGPYQMAAPLSNYFAVRVQTHPGVNFQNMSNAYMLFGASRKIHWFHGDEYWVSKTIASPSNIIRGNIWKTDSEPLAPREYLHYRDKTDVSPAAFYTSVMTRAGKYMDIPDYGRIHLWEMSQPNTILPPAYYYVCAGKDTQKNWYFEVPSTPPMVAARPPPIVAAAPLIAVAPTPVPPPSMLKHVIRGFMELAVLKKEKCPIILEELTQENIAYTSCGHLFSADAIIRHIEIGGCCASCRGKLSAFDIYRW